MKWVKRTVVVLLSLVVLGGLLRAWMPKPVPADLATVTRGSLRVLVEEDGQSRVTDRYAVSAPITGNLGRLELDPGDAVEAGQILARIVPVSPPLLDSRTRAEAEARVRAAKAARQQSEASVKRALVALRYAEREQERLATLAKAGATADRDAEWALTEQHRCEEELNSARFGRRVAEHQLSMAQAALGIVSSSQRNSAQMEVPAPVEGRVLRVMRESEGVVQMGEDLLELGDPSALEVVVDVLTEDAVKIRRGAPVAIVRWGGPDSLSAHVRLVEPSAFTRVSALGVEEQRVNIIIDVDEPYEKWSRLGDGYRVEAQITVLELDDVLKAPASAVFRVDDDRVVFLVKDGRVERRAVSTGATTGLEIQIEAGLEEGDVVVTYPTESIKEGVEVIDR